MTRPITIVTIILTNLFGCQKKDQNQDLSSLRNTIDYMIETNSWYYHKLEGRAIQNEELQKYRPSLDSIKRLMDLKKEHDILSTEWLSAHHIKEFEVDFEKACTPYLGDKSAIDLQESWSNFETHITSWKKVADSEKSHEQLLVLLDVLRLEQLIMNAVRERIGYSMIDYFFARADFYHKDDTLKVGETYRAFIAVGKPEIEQYKYLELADPIIHFYNIDGDDYQDLKENPDYQLTSFEPWSWIIVFGTDKPGLYAVGISSHVTSQLMDEDEKSIQLIRGISQPFLVTP